MAERNRKILLVSYYFPPLGMGGVGRPMGLFKYLPRFGCDVMVLTVKKVLYPEYDYSLLENLDTAKILRTGSHDPARLLYLLGIRRLRVTQEKGSRAGRRYFPDAKIGWKRYAIRKGCQLIENNKFDAVITTSPPISAHLIGLELKRKYGLPWVADFRDLWFSRPIEEVYANEKMIQMAQKLKEHITKQAYEVVAVNNDIKKYLGRGEVITNGADPEHIDIWRTANTQPDQKFTIGILGTINYLCPVEPLFEAMRLLNNNEIKIKREICVVHAGHYDANMMKGLLAKYRLHDRVQFKGYLPRKESIAALAGADMLYLGVGKFGGHNILPGRIFDYLISGKPILGVVPEHSDAAALINEYGRGKVVSDGDAKAIASYIKEFALVSTGSPELVARDYHSLYKYTTLAMAEKYGALLERILK